MRSADWLQQQVDELLRGPFADLEVVNRLEVHWGRKAGRRFGSITMSRDKKESRITINGYFRDETVPEAVVQATLAHELSHYAHGFSSPLPKKYKSPHAGGVILREFKKRGLEMLFHYEKQWSKAHWGEYLKSHAAPRVPRSLSRRPRATGLLRLLRQFEW
jgi:hypothetical protein